MKQQALFKKQSSKLPDDFTRTHCEANGKLCPYYRPQEMPKWAGGIPNQATCNHPAIREQTDLEWKMDCFGVEYFITVQLKNGKTRRRKASQTERPDYIPNMAGCPGRGRQAIKGGMHPKTQSSRESAANL
ncbi:MAG: hypothetical protein R6U41_07275 [Desulfosalsimonas sp.]|uniref:hypothetical protein n=1 Tax=Desulfosalsimonas sp. TaxID=3073848 RepID=UPI003970EC51